MIVEIDGQPDRPTVIVTFEREFSVHAEFGESKGVRYFHNEREINPWQGISAEWDLEAAAWQISTSLIRIGISNDGWALVDRASGVQIAGDNWEGRINFTIIA